MFILLYEGEADWQECLSVHMEKDIVEQAFRQLQGDAEASPLNVHKEETVRGLVFVGFLSLVLRTRLSRRVKETGLSKRYTVDSLLLELEGIKKIELEDGSFITTQLTRRQKEILRRLRLST
jgi:transposase